jgi:hypothetical protein
MMVGGESLTATFWRQMAHFYIIHVEGVLCRWRLKTVAALTGM